ncbi:hypothetical protein TcasGA2_TC002301 [Tribolium castaneum]|uniref:Uncharacterized protein n=1 Tax=Tribolium castaneum TaxID=7070 RepID=D7EHR3_TRICA|nr:hypothetical protein TcasGA2_TC002301 [Tribolium castaneum]
MAVRARLDTIIKTDSYVKFPVEFESLKTWGLFLDNLELIGEIDLILGSDCFYEPSVFEDSTAHDY